jgi:hypothetical protein
MAASLSVAARAGAVPAGIAAFTLSVTSVIERS